MKPVFETTGTCLNIKLPEELDHPASELIRRESDRIMGKIYIRTIYLDIEDDGIGIADVEKAMEPLYTTRADQDRSGMGFTFMEAFMDEVKVTSQVGKGTCVHMSKKIGN